MNASALTLMALTLAGCAAFGAGPRAPNDGRYALADSESALGYEKTDWERPFWERWAGPPRPEASANTQVATADSATTHNPSATASAPAAVPTQVPATQLRPSTLQPQIGIYLDEDENSDSTRGYQLVNALADGAREYGMTIVKPGALTDGLSDASTCAVPTAVRCRQTLAVYPGVRALIILRLQEGSAGGRTTVVTRMADTDFGVDYDPMTTRLSLAAALNTTEQAELSAWSRRVLDAAADRIAIAPWFTHSFAREGKSVYVSAGPRSGLKTGTILAVHGEGSIVRAPGGSVVGWNPGPVVGRLEVEKPIGQDASIAKSVSGRMPQPPDRLTVIE